MAETQSIPPVEINEKNFPTYDSFINECEKRLISTVLEAFNGNVTAASKLLDISRMTMYRLLKKHGFEVTPLSKRTKMIGKLTVEYALKAHGYDIENAARDLNITRAEMYALINVHKIEIPNDSDRLQ
jgi:DNA-binding NtrC family response regulator